MVGQTLNRFFPNNPNPSTRKSAATAAPVSFACVRR
jgi:hypothetical protein